MKRVNSWFAVSLFFVLSAAMISGCTTIPKQPPISHQDEVYLKDICEKNGILWQWDQVAQVVTLSYKDVKAQVLIGSETAVIGDDRVTLSAPIRYVKSAVIVPRDFQWKVIDQLRQTAVSHKGYGIPKIRKIMIDAGHGGKDPGAIGRTGTQEKGVILDIAKRLRDVLIKKGFQVEMTRSSDTFIPLEQRTEMASRAKADLFISIHANSSPAQSVQGVEVYATEELSFMDKIAVERKNNERVLFENLAMKRGAPELDMIVSDMLYVHKIAESQALSENVSKKVSKAIKTKNRGAKTERFNVLRNSLVPAILVEVGFLTNPKEEKLLNMADYRQKIALSLGESIVDYAHGK